MEITSQTDLNGFVWWLSGHRLDVPHGEFDIAFSHWQKIWCFG